VVEPSERPSYIEGIFAEMQIRIFDVEHGGCALVTADTGARILIDCGHNGSTGWRPSTYLRQLSVGHLEKLIITNYDEDHASDLANLVKTVSIGVLVSNPSVTAAQLRQLKKIGGVGSGIDALADMKSRYTGSVIGDGADFGNLSTTFFWNRYPTEFEDENNLSLVVIMKAHGLTICFPGDMEVQGWETLLRNPAFVQAMGEVNVFVASHHGRANGCSGQLFSQTGLNPVIVVISDSGVEYATQETVGWYRNRTKGMMLNGENRHVLTTRRDGRVLLEALPNATTVSVGV
jgi:beta-lactamase superfamily II metal-dependent hydrolase